MSARQADGRKFGEQGRAAVDVLHDAGITGYRFSKSKHAEVSFDLNGEEVSYRFACSPRSAGGAAKTVRRKLRALIDKARGKSADVAPEEKQGGEPMVHHPEKENPMLQESMVLPAKNGNGVHAPLAPDLTGKPAPYGLSEARKKLRWLLSTPPTNSALRMEINPAMATAMMERNADDEWRNRPHSSRALRRYVAAMQRGWRFTGEPIIFSGSGRLLNGQHRLMACIEANVAFPCLVVFDIEDDAFKYMDIGSTRTAGHIFGIEGIPNYNWAAAVARILFFYTTRPRWDGRTVDIENDQLLEFYRQHEGIQDSYTLSQRMGKEGLLPQRWAGFVHYICAQKHRAEAERFFEKVITGIGLTSKSEAEYLIRRKLQSNVRVGASEKEADIHLAAYTVQAWNAHRRDEKRTLLRWRGGQNPHESFPRAQ